MDVALEDAFQTRIDESAFTEARDIGQLRALAAKGPVTLLTATKDIGISQAAVLAQLLQHSE